MKTERILVTGSSGFIGGHIAASLVKSGREVLAQYRRPIPPPHLLSSSDEGVELIRVDLSNSGDIDKLVDGITGVIHAAAFVSDYGPYELFYDNNYQATVDLLTAARKAGAKRFVFVSSITVHGFGEHDNTNEDGPYFKLTSHYQRTKKMAEEYILSQSTASFPCTAIRPGLVYGPRDDTTLSPVFKMLERGMLPFIGGFEKLNCPVYVEDLVDAAILAYDNPSVGGMVFNITSGERTSLRGPIELAAELLSVKPPRIDVPVAVAYTGAAVLEGVARLLRLKNAPILTLYRISQLAHNFHFSIERARNYLGYSPSIPWPEGLRRAIDAYLDVSGRDHGDLGAPQSQE